ncbi:MULTISPECIES: hypothetical protein [unclassified Pseudomonas]|uniref:hypothetical protein n=1 Tax=unclassified Pseudomonas TaxID=196821 RepID=UPI000C9B04F0|nr:MULTISPECIES: hypothetical protein [unclassified Pseudomonas]PNA01236.1 hypothetical protein C1X28_25650 [Pseudomonas sp. FW305-BF15]PNB78256.1 hypothetical protein C1X30_24590 [Pseudomonas sp. FW305-BF6]
MTYCMLSLDLANADDEQRTNFYAVLEVDDWVKLADVDTVWQKRFDDTFVRPSIQRRVITVLERAADTARIRLVTFAAQIGDNPASTGRTVKVVGGFETSFN